VGGAGLGLDVGAGRAWLVVSDETWADMADPLSCFSDGTGRSVLLDWILSGGGGKSKKNVRYIFGVVLG